MSWCGRRHRAWRAVQPLTRAPTCVAGRYRRGGTAARNDATARNGWPKNLAAVQRPFETEPFSPLALANFTAHAAVVVYQRGEDATGIDMSNKILRDNSLNSNIRIT